MKKNIILYLLLFCFALPLKAQMGAGTRDSVLARENFRLGVQAFYRSAFNEAINALEKALAYLPDEPLIYEWLGNAYYKSGFDDSALRQWDLARQRYSSEDLKSTQLSSKIEQIKNRHIFLPSIDEAERYVEAASFQGINREAQVFLNPSAILPRADGWAWVVAHGSNELVLLDANGLVRQRVRGPINGFDRPWDIVSDNSGRLYVSEQSGGRISVLDSKGKWLFYIGKKGRKLGELIGPEALTIDSSGNILVVDYGNMRVQKFSAEGEPLLTFGGRRGAFPGFRSPSGIVSLDESIWVADAAHKALFRFDQSGNYMGMAGEGALKRPESLKVDRQNRILIADTMRLILFDPSNEKTYELGSLGQDSGRMVGAALDINANILVANHAKNEVHVFSRVEDLAAGMNIWIERIDASHFPHIRFELSVEDRRRRPISGLSELNFLIQEEGRNVEELIFLGTGDREEEVDLSLLIARENKSSTQYERIVQIAEDFLGAGANFSSIVQGLSPPVLEKPKTKTALAQALKGPTANNSGYFDLALRLAVSDLINASSKRSVVYIGSGNLHPRSFENYSVQELSAYLANNRVMFNVLILEGQEIDHALEYLARQSGGQVIHAFRPSGLLPLVDSIRSMQVGTYSFSYTSKLSSDWGQRFLPIEAEVYMHSRSGADRKQYFAPLE